MKECGEKKYGMEKAEIMSDDRIEKMVKTDSNYQISKMKKKHTLVTWFSGTIPEVFSLLVKFSNLNFNFV